METTWRTRIWRGSIARSLAIRSVDQRRIMIKNQAQLTHKIKNRSRSFRGASASSLTCGLGRNKRSYQRNPIATLSSSKRSTQTTWSAATCCWRLRAALSHSVCLSTWWTNLKSRLWYNSRPSRLSRRSTRFYSRPPSPKRSTCSKLWMMCPWSRSETTRLRSMRTFANKRSTRSWRGRASKWRWLNRKVKQVSNRSSGFQ